MLEEFDADELFHLAIKSSESGAHDKSLSFLKRGLELEPSARFHYMLGAQYAEIGMFDRAALEMEKSLVIDAGLLGAWFQLGLLYFLAGKREDCLRAWSNLDNTDENNAYRVFKDALLCSDAGDSEQAELKFSQGFLLTNQDDPLHRDMLKYRERMRAALKKATENTEPEADKHYLLSAYKGSSH